MLQTDVLNWIVFYFSLEFENLIRSTVKWELKNHEILHSVVVFVIVGLAVGRRLSLANVRTVGTRAPSLRERMRSQRTPKNVRISFQSRMVLHNEQGLLRLSVQHDWLLQARLHTRRRCGKTYYCGQQKSSGTFDSGNYNVCTQIHTRKIKKNVVSSKKFDQQTTTSRQSAITKHYHYYYC